MLLIHSYMFWHCKSVNPSNVHQFTA